VTVTDSTGTVVATQQVVELQSFAFVLPAGHYTLTGYCAPVAVDVNAGRHTQADLVCNAP
jgi:hypothetical protein